MRERNSMRTILASAVITGVFTFFTTVLIDHYTTKKKSLLYDTQTSIPFQRDSLNVRIHNLELLNDGDEPVEDIRGQVGFKGQTIKGYKVRSSPILGIADTLDGSRYLLRLASLNPSERLTVSFLVTSTEQVDSLPNVAIRARGILDTEKRDGSGRQGGQPFYRVLLLAILLAVCLTSLPVILIRKRWRKRFLDRQGILDNTNAAP